MGNQNSLDLAYYVDLLAELVMDLADRLDCSQTVYPSRCITVIRQRVQHEGIEFLTKTLPRLGKALDRALSTESLFTPVGFKSDRSLPRFLGWAFEQVFDVDGRPLREANVLAIAGLRQVLYSMYKLDLPRKKEDDHEVIKNFIRVDGELAAKQHDTHTGRAETVRIVARLLASVLSGLDPSDIHPRHGPGAVATGERGHKKFQFKRIYRPLQALYPFDSYFCFSQSHVCDAYRDFEQLEVLEHATAKVVLVPKDSRGPRLISCEPLEIQWIQQGLAKSVVAVIQNHRLTSGHVNFDDQGVNRALALEGSRSGEWVTLDMKEASDRVSLALVTEVVPEPLLSALLASRSAATRLPDGSVMPLNKFAPMGSALCFPIEALIFWALSVATLMTHRSLRLREAARRVYVYGDDIIVRREDYAPIMQVLPLFSLEFNEGKCCTHGSFRESCGVDAYAGVDVTPTKFRRAMHHYRSSPNLVSWIEYSNSLWQTGFVRSALFIQRAVEAVISVPFADPIPVTVKPRFAPEFEDWSTLGVCFAPAERNVFSIRRRARTRYNRRYQRLEVCAPKIEAKHYMHSFDNWSSLLRWQTQRSEERTRSCEEYPIGRRTALKKTWTPIG